VAIIGFNSPEWFISDVASIFAGGMAAGIYPTNSPDACKHIMLNCRANILVVEDAKQLEKFLPYRDELVHLKAIVQYTGTPTTEGVISWSNLLEMGAKEAENDLEARLDAIAINQCCHLVYTSGTTGLPKGVMLSHDNLTYTAKRLCSTFDLRVKEERLVSYLPLSHVAANIADIYAMISIVGTVYFADKNALKGTLTQSLKEALPTIFFGVPRVWEKIYEKMQEVGRRNKGLKEQIGTWAKKTGLEHNRYGIHQIILTFFFIYSEFLTRQKAGKCALREKIKNNSEKM
jgi:long-chain-fatty-acid--CoA ligase ACSBG